MLHNSIISVREYVLFLAMTEKRCFYSSEFLCRFNLLRWCFCTIHFASTVWTNSQTCLVFNFNLSFNS